MSGLEIDAARPGDVAAIQTVGLLAWPPTYLPLAGPQFVIEGLARWWSAEAVRQEVSAGQVTVARRDGRVVATATVGRLGADHVLWKFYVLPAEQGRGVGRPLMDAVIARVPDGTDLILEAVEANARARRFYESAGFAVDSRDSDSSVPHLWYRRRGGRGGIPHA